MENNFIYLDNASTTPLSENVLNIINNFKDNGMYTPRSSNKSIDISKVNDMISNAETMSEKL